jgi:ParB/RepB/Spo0J family partition protein
VPSPLNARKHFDDAALEETAGSIKAMGLLQNLVAKPLPDGRAELVCGERRWRSIALLIERGDWDATAPTIPVMVRQMTEAQHRAIMLIENLARRDLTPLEEARGFAELQALDPDTYTTDRIAADCGFTPRLIQQRLALLRLPGPVLTALDAGQINVSAARALCRAPTADMQLTILAGILAGDRHLKTTAGIQETITRGMIPVSRAKFDIQDYIDAAEGHDGAQIVEFEGNGARYFPNADLFRGLQEAWAERRCHALLADGWAWARVEPTLAAWKYDRVEGMTPGAGCVIVLSPTDASVTEHTGLIPKPTQAAPTAPTWSQVDIEDLTRPPAPTPAPPTTHGAPLAPAAPPPPAPKPNPLAGLTHADTHAHRTAMDFFRGRLLAALAANPTDMMILMILDRGRPHTDSLFERVHSGDCVLPVSLFYDDEGDPGPLFHARYHGWVDDVAGLPSETTCVFADRDAMGRALLDLIQHADPAAIAETWAALMADTIFLDSGDLHPVWRDYATLRGIPLPAHFQNAGATHA